MGERPLEGQVALITGGARGIGRAIAIKLAKAGVSIAITGRFKESDDTVPYQTTTLDDRDKTIAMVEEVGGKCLSFAADVRSFDDMSKVVEQIMARFGRLDIVVANAGVFSGGVPIHQLSDNEWQRMMDVSVTGIWNTARAAIPHMLEAGRGNIVLISSVAGIKGGNAGFGHYATAKHAVTGLGRALATELGPNNIRVNTVCPTSVATPMSENQFYYDLFSGGTGGTKEQAQEIIKSMHSLPVAAIQPEDVANAVGWLVSDEARYVHGIILPVDAGASMY
ncbi:MAG: mycofactocin-coupled SDR family oxidoreductase [Pseudomonadales bacterium]|nr:mycofactocin-coupled SDR family oxidoreductase [Pseudomonadales bacterium]MCP5171114.1 mycofactocin-coupled SDR family oxidoreductase [Pseudomonadales bacterium]MCP5301649.1 mycofactocin-coupled SDR family oxidoreductase [Pseudomonadales bacterium]